MTATQGTYKCGLWGCGQTAYHEVTVLMPSGCPETIMVCNDHKKAVPNGTPAYRAGPRPFDESESDSHRLSGFRGYMS